MTASSPYVTGAVGHAGATIQPPGGNPSAHHPKPNTGRMINRPMHPLSHARALDSANNEPLKVARKAGRALPLRAVARIRIDHQSGVADRVDQEVLFAAQEV